MLVTIRRQSYYLVSGLFFLAAVVAYGQEVIDGVVAVVGDEIVLKSELDQMAQYYAVQMGLQPLEHKNEYGKLKKEILQKKFFAK